jgi:hypothetical protein
MIPMTQHFLKLYKDMTLTKVSCASGEESSNGTYSIQTADPDEARRDRRRGIAIKFLFKNISLERRP